jgi:hypothetical protein
MRWCGKQAAGQIKVCDNTQMASNDHDAAITEERIRVAEISLSRQLDWVSRADTKASFIVGLSTAMLGVLAAVATPPNTWAPSLVVLVATVIIFLGLSLCLIYWATYPRLSGPKDSLIFFGAIAHMSYAEFEHATLDSTTDTRLADLLQQCHRNASIADCKYRYVKAAYQMVSLPVWPWALTVYIFRTISH